MTRRTAFTLVELMVVISIISLLIAIVAPTLGAARALAYSARCRTNLNALAKSSAVYTEQNRGFMMVYMHRFVTVDGVDYIAAPEQPSKTTLAFIPGSIDPATGLFSDARNFGLVYAAGILDKPEMFYCPATPSNEDAKRHRLNSYPTPWGSAGTSGTQWIRMGYMWNPWVKVLSGSTSDDNLCTYDDALILDRHPNDRCITSDLLWSQNVSGHVEGNKAHWNLGYPDGHVTPFEDKALWSQYLSTVDTGAQWGDWNRITRPRLPGH